MAPPTIGRKVPVSWRCHPVAADLSKVRPSSNHWHFDLSLEWWSMSCWSLKDEFKHNHRQTAWVLSEWWSLSCWSLNNDFKHNHRQISECWIVFNELLISHDHVQVSIIDIFSSLQPFSRRCWFLNVDFKSHHRQFFSLEWWSMSCWFLEVQFNSQSWTNWLQACRWLRPFSSMWNELVLSLCLNWMTHVSGKLLLVLDAELPICKHVWDVWMPQQS